MAKVILSSLICAAILLCLFTESHAEGCKLVVWNSEVGAGGTYPWGNPCYADGNWCEYYEDPANPGCFVLVCYMSNDAMYQQSWSCKYLRDYSPTPPFGIPCGGSVTRTELVYTSGNLRDASICPSATCPNGPSSEFEEFISDMIEDYESGGTATERSLRFTCDCSLRKCIRVQVTP